MRKFKAILYYDWFLTLSDEIERFWNRKNFTWASLFFFFNRYLVIFGNIPVILQSFWEPTNVSTKDMAAPPLAKGAGSVFTNAISATMMSRLMLNLRDPAMADLYSGRTPQGDVDTTLPVVTSVFDDHTIVRTAKSDEDDEPEQDLRTLHSSEASNNLAEML
ncbi:hypothetical protein HWV62_14516 [Athelia sp. TMB]|nr:hypothetical protein HWV62_14516 [Athelia sp. TMB]